MFLSQRRITSKLWKIIVSTNPHAAIFNRKPLYFVINIFIITAPVPVAQENKRNVIKWMVDAQYKKEQVKYKVKVLFCIISFLYINSLYQIYFILYRHILIVKFEINLLYKLLLSDVASFSYSA